MEVRIDAGEGVRYYERTLSTLDSQNVQPDVQPGGHLILLRDVTERRSLEERLEHQALHDPLTNLPNRTLLTDHISHAVERAKQRVEARQVKDQEIEEWRDGYAVAILFIDLDDFKAVNDSLGHEAGDTLLVMVAQRIKDCLSPEYVLARLGGDEFVALVEDAQRKETIKIAERIVQELGKPFYVEGHELFTSASIGISRSGAVKDEQEGVRGEYLLKEADIAMYQAKQRDKTSYEIFEGWMEFRGGERLKLSNDLRRAVEHEEFVLQYQPIAHLATGKIEGFEALLRWEHPERGLLLPDEFIYAAEESDLMVSLVT